MEVPYGQLLRVEVEVVGGYLPLMGFYSTLMMLEEKYGQEKEVPPVLGLVVQMEVLLVLPVPGVRQTVLKEA